MKTATARDEVFPFVGVKGTGRNKTIGQGPSIDPFIHSLTLPNMIITPIQLPRGRTPLSRLLIHHRIHGDTDQNRRRDITRLHIPLQLIRRAPEVQQIDDELPERGRREDALADAVEVVERERMGALVLDVEVGDERVHDGVLEGDAFDGVAEEVRVDEEVVVWVDWGFVAVGRGVSLVTISFSASASSSSSSSSSSLTRR